MKTSVYLSGAQAARMRELGLTPSELVRRGLAASEPEPLETTVRRVLREELGALLAEHRAPLAESLPEP